MCNIHQPTNFALWKYQVFHIDVINCVCVRRGGGGLNRRVYF